MHHHHQGHQQMPIPKLVQCHWHAWTQERCAALPAKAVLTPCALGLPHPPHRLGSRLDVSGSAAVFEVLDVVGLALCLAGCCIQLQVCLADISRIARSCFQADNASKGASKRACAVQCQSHSIRNQTVERTATWFTGLLYWAIVFAIQETREDIG